MVSRFFSLSLNLSFVSSWCESFEFQLRIRRESHLEAFGKKLKGNIWRLWTEFRRLVNRIESCLTLTLRLESRWKERFYISELSFVVLRIGFLVSELSCTSESNVTFGKSLKERFDVWIWVSLSLNWVSSYELLLYSINTGLNRRSVSQNRLVRKYEGKWVRRGQGLTEFI